MNVFKFNDIDLRTLVIDGVPYIIGADAAKVLGLTNTGMAYRRLGDDEKRYIRREDVGLAPGRLMVAVTESGLHKLVMRSDKPVALKFQDWLAREVLPAIRETGGYCQNWSLLQKCQLRPTLGGRRIGRKIP